MSINKYRPIQCIALLGLVQTVPSLALLGFCISVPLLLQEVLAQSFGVEANLAFLIPFGASAVVFATVVYALFPIVLNTYTGIMQVDPLRLVEAVIAGVAFIGAGTIFGESRRGGETISGITTAASLLTVAVIGVAAGLDYYLVAGTATALSLFVLVALSWWEKRKGLQEAAKDPQAAVSQAPSAEDPARVRRR